MICIFKKSLLMKENSPSFPSLFLWLITATYSTNSLLNSRTEHKIVITLISSTFPGILKIIRNRIKNYKLKCFMMKNCFFLILNVVFEKWDDRRGHKSHDKNSATEIFC